MGREVVEAKVNCARASGTPHRRVLTRKGKGRVTQSQEGGTHARVLVRATIS